jgi:pyruvate,water dikinase
LKHKTSETNQAIFRLASTIQTSPELRSRILEVPSNQLLNQLSLDESPATVRFVSELESFFKEYGVRGFTREPYYPRWQDAPEHVFNILKSMVQDEGSTGEESVSCTKAHDAISEQEIAARVKSKNFGWAKWKLISIVLGFARKYIIFRENQRFNLDRWITMNRRIFLEIGKNLQALGILREPSDVFFLRKNEIHKIVERKYDIQEMKRIKQAVQERKSEFLRNEHVTPPKFLRGEIESQTPHLTFETTLQGIPASRGLLSGPVRVLDRIDDIWRVRSGEILVVPRTDPGWTPVFCKIGGLVTETGGLLSHGAVVSREYGIPAVTNIPDACRIFKTGQIVTIDGSKGTVTIV